MAKGSLKKIYAKNTAYMQNAFSIAGAVWLIYIGVEVLWGYDSMTWGSWILLAFYLAVNGYILSSLRSMGRATFDERGQVTDVRMNLDAPGYIEYHWDLLYITWAIMILTLYTAWALVLYLGVPAYAFYLFKDFTKGSGEAQEDDDADKSRRERRAAKRKPAVPPQQRK
eukprot:TRINITY_DN15566_c0_g1_i1.p1 TRINITY_DN15566_c0_g1~~TRINITY_DN15566_c0_g1_i1.p1  ORF type:complete len:182 (-),score=32.52 TRINITY_DN15566_c0_g1_i1:21-527(-)